MIVDGCGVYEGEDDCRYLIVSCALFHYIEVSSAKFVGKSAELLVN